MDKLNETLRLVIGNLVVEGIQKDTVIADLTTQLSQAKVLIAKLQPPVEPVELQKVAKAK